MSNWYDDIPSIDEDEIETESGTTSKEFFQALAKDKEELETDKNFSAVVSVLGNFGRACWLSENRPDLVREYCESREIGDGTDVWEKRDTDWDALDATPLIEALPEKFTRN